MIGRSWVWVGAVVAVGVVSGAVPVRGQTLEQAMIEAYLGNPTLGVQRASLRATDEQIPQALSNWRPTLTAEGDAGTEAINNSAATGTARGQHRDPRSMSLALQQPLYRGGRTLAATREAENAVRAARARLAAVEQTVLLDATTSFANVFRDQAVLRLNIANEQRLRRQLEATRDRFEVGEITRTDVFQAEARLARATADRIQAEGTLEASRAAYRNAVGNAPGVLSQPAMPTDIPETFVAALDRATEDNPSVAAAEFDERAAIDNIDEVRGELLPTISLNGSASRSFETASEDSRIDDIAATLNLTVPLYQSGAVYSRLREARQLAAQARRTLEQARRDTIESATRAWNDLETARAQIQSFTTEVEANQVALEGVEREAAVGARTVLDILDAEQELLDAQVNLVRAERDAVVAAFELKTALGAMTVVRLGLDVELYDPDAHYREVRGKWFGGSSSGEVDTSGGGGTSAN